jgi:glycosyltransferase involved in cell wall biosynthesis
LDSNALVQHLRSPQTDGLVEALHLATSIICVSRFLARRIRIQDIDDSKIAVIYDGIDTERFRPGVIDRREARKRFGIPDGARVMLTIARLTANKRIELILDSFERIASRFSDALLVVVGEAYGPSHYVARLRRHVDSMRARNKLLFLGFQEDIRWIEVAADIQVLCSDNEPLGTCIPESMSLGIPPIVNDGGGLCEIVEDQRSGFIVPAGVEDILTERVSQLLASDDLRMEFGRRARERVYQQCSIRTCSDAVLKLYQSIRA